MPNKQFVMNISIYVEAENEQEALKVLLNESSLHAIAQAIEANRENIKEIYREDDSVTLIN